MLLTVALRVPEGAAAITGTAVEFDNVRVEVTGAVAVGETWTLSLNGTDFFYVVLSSNTLDDVANGLRNAINAGTLLLTATVINGTTIVIDQDDPLVTLTPFTVVLTVEPVISLGSGRPVDGGDGWMVRMSDGGLSAHYEETIVITRDRPIVLTATAGAGHGE